MSTLALYRAYRPGRFADVVGQDHVTEPLTRALANNRVHHAYLFSGPRGCGKTSSARILARSLNCEEGPTPTPCEQCQSCRDLAPGGAGSIDVVELDAATHGLVDDARDLREKAHFAPLSSRYKVYIIDEAHQLGPGAANALLKLIEEPPAHLKFIFATTAPDKILGTIRSRTHHYPFRLIPARTLQRNLAWICEQEGVPIEPAALALVARAGAGSARDAQSILGQLIAGSTEEGVTHPLAVALLGFTDAALLDEVVDAVATSDGAALFRAVDQVMDSGHDPRRFLTDLLERFRDLIVIGQVPDAVTSGLLDVPDEQAQQLAAQAGRLGTADLLRLADVVDNGITAMKGATPTRLQLELVCARLLLPGAEDSVSGVQARLDRLERRLALGDAAPAQGSPPAPPEPARSPFRPVVVPDLPDTPAEEVRADRPPAETTPAVATPAVTTPAVTTPAGDTSADETSDGSPRVANTPVGEGSVETRPAAEASASPAGESPPAASGGDPSQSAKVRQLWPDVMNRLKEIKRTPWSLIASESTVIDVADGVLTLAFRVPALRDTFARREDFQTYLRQAITDTLGIDLRVNAIVDPSVDTGGGVGGGGMRTDSRPTRERNAPEPAPAPQAGRADAAKAAMRRTGTHQPAEGAPAAAVASDADAAFDDADVEDHGLSERELLQRALGATVIEEIEHEP